MNPTTEKILTAAQGYRELGMYEDAWAELEALPFDDTRTSSRVLDLRVECCMGLEKWAMGAEIARGGIKKDRECLALYIHGAYCIRRSESLEAAFDFLVSGHLYADKEQPARGFWWFNMACYHSQLGRIEQARDCLKHAVEADERLRDLVFEDEDLEPLWDSLAMEWP